MPYLNTTRILIPTVRPNTMIATMNALIEGLAFSGRHIFVGQAGAIFGINRVRLASAKADDKVGPINTPITSALSHPAFWAVSFLRLQREPYPMR